MTTDTSLRSLFFRERARTRPRPLRSIGAVAVKLSSVRSERDSTSIVINQGIGRGGKPFSIRFQSTPPVFCLDPFAFFIHHARLEHCRGAFPVKLDPAFDLRLRHFVAAADAFGNFATSWAVDSSIGAAHHKSIFVNFATAIAACCQIRNVPHSSRYEITSLRAARLRVRFWVAA